MPAYCEHQLQQITRRVDQLGHESLYEFLCRSKLQMSEEGNGEDPEEAGNDSEEETDGEGDGDGKNGGEGEGEGEGDRNGLDLLFSDFRQHFPEFWKQVCYEARRLPQSLHVFTFLPSSRTMFV